MRFIGQYIQSLIARFRNDVYLEDISTGTIVSGGNLGLDSNNKIVKATVSSGSGDITSVVAGIGLSGGATDGDAALSIDFSEFSGVTPVHGDMLATLDADGSTHQLTHIRDLAVLFAGSGLTATNSVISVDTLNQNTTGSAATLTTSRNFITDLSSTSLIVFNGSTDATLGVTGTLAIGNGGTGQTTAQAAINALAGGTTAGRFLRGNGSNVVLSTIDSADIPTLNQNTTGVAAGLTASTSNSIGVGSIELGHADDTTIARSAAGIITVEGKEVRTIDRNIHVQHSVFRDNISTDEHWIPIHSVDEKTNNTNEHIPLLAPYAGKLLELHYRVSKNTNVNSNTATFKLYKIPGTKNINTTHNVILDTQVVSTPPTNAEDESTNVVKVTFDSDAAFAQHDLLAISIQHGANKADGSSITDTNTKFYITTIWEYDLSSM